MASAIIRVNSVRVLGVLALALTTPIQAQRTGQVLRQLISETQKQTDDPEDVTMVWWIPQEFWKLSAGQNPSVTENDLREFLRILEPYTIVVIADGHMGRMGEVEYRPVSTTRDSLDLVDAAGAHYRALDSTQVGDTAAAFAAFVLRPMFINMLGPMGANMHVFFFPARNAGGGPLADPSRPGTLTARLGSRTFVWQLPLGALLPPRYCPVDGESFSGAYVYCPRHGNRLVDKPPAH